MSKLYRWRNEDEDWEFELAEPPQEEGHDQFKDYAAIIATVMPKGWSCSLKYLKGQGCYRFAFYPAAFEEEDEGMGWVGVYVPFAKLAVLRRLPLEGQRKTFGDLFSAFEAMWGLRLMKEDKVIEDLLEESTRLMPEGWVWAIGAPPSVSS